MEDERMAGVQRLLETAWRPSPLDGYHGWANRETWDMAIWLGEDWEEVHRAVTEAVGAGISPAEAVKALVDGIIDAWRETDDTPGMLRDLLWDALERVDWDAVGEAFL